ncbi:MAG: LPS export ABC transporter permease LptG [Desulfuromusa sp.]|nr:LPS export ABC transporter permease LptG [Desulfuromusa sp.]
MRILKWLLLKSFIRILLLCTAAFICIYLLIDFFEKIDKFIDHNAVALDYFTYFFNSIPTIFIQILPLAILTTMVLTLGGFSRTNEITAMRACGISLLRIIQPLMSLTLILSLLLLLLNEFIIPWNSKQLNYLLEIKLSKNEQMQLTRNELWYRSKNRIISIAVADPQKQQLQGVTIFTFDDQQRMKKRQDSPFAEFDKGKWQASTLIEHTFDSVSGELSESNKLNNVALDLNRSPDDFSVQEDLKNELNYLQLATLVDKLEGEGYDATHQRVDMQNRLAQPLTCLIMGFLGIPFALQRGRNSNIAMGIGLSLGIGVAYFILQSMVTAFGYANALPPLAAAWSANFIFLLLGIWLLLNIKE